MQRPRKPAHHTISSLLKMDDDITYCNSMVIPLEPIDQAREARWHSMLLDGMKSEFRKLSSAGKALVSAKIYNSRTGEYVIIDASEIGGK